MTIRGRTWKFMLKLSLLCLAGSFLISAALLLWSRVLRQFPQEETSNLRDFGRMHSFISRSRSFHDSDEQGWLYFLSIGDQGTGNAYQHEVANGMAQVAERYNVSFVVGLGDNVYPSGVHANRSAVLKERFDEPYMAEALRRLPWYMTLGDHDHRGNVSAQVEYRATHSNWHMEGQYFTVSTMVGKGINLHMIFTDSVLLEGGIAKPGMRRRFRKDYDEAKAGKVQGLLHWKWLQKTLRDLPSNDWRVVVGHRPVHSNCKRKVSALDIRFRTKMKELLESNLVDLYLNGHDHTAQLIADGGVHYMVNGIGGHGLHDVQPKPDNVLYQSSGFHGFALHAIKGDSMAISFYNDAGTLQHKQMIRKDTPAL